MKWAQIIKEAIVLFVVAICVGLTVNALSPQGISLSSCFNLSAPSTDCPFPIVDVVGAKRIFDNGSALFVDARSDEQYAEGHIPGARSLPAYNDDSLFPFLNAVQPDVPIVTYCSCITCGDSHLLAETLAEMGYVNVKIFADGMAGWQEAGYAIAKN